MRRYQPIILAFAFLLTLLALGIPYWQIPYSQVSVPTSLSTAAMVTAFVVAALLRLVFRVSFLPAFLFVGLAFPVCIMARVEVETFQDPTTHNLWPFEVILAAGVGFSLSLAGSVIGGLMAWLVKNASARDGG